MRVKHRAFSWLAALLLLLAAAPALCAAPPPASAAAVVDRVRALKPANVELQSVVVKDAQGNALQGALADAPGGTVEVSGYAAGGAGVAGYLGSITHAGVGEVNLKEIRPETIGAQRRTHFVFLVALPAQGAQTIANDFVSIDASADVWYAGARFSPHGKAVHGVPLGKIDARWCAADEFRKELFPRALYGLELDGLDALMQNGGAFALTGKLPGVGQVTVLTGVFQTCAGKTGSFLLALRDAAAAQPVLYLQENAEKAAFTFLMGDVHQFTLNDCIGCDPGPSYTWIGTEYAANVRPAGEHACLDAGIPLRSAESEHSAPVYTPDTPQAVTILKVGKREGDFYWHQVRVNRGGKVGYVLNRSFTDECGE